MKNGGFREILGKKETRRERDEGNHLYLLVPRNGTEHTSDSKANTGSKIFLLRLRPLRTHGLWFAEEKGSEQVKPWYARGRN